MDLLPNELLHHILSYLPGQALHRISQTSAHLRQLALDPHLWRARCMHERGQHIRPKRYSWRQLYFSGLDGACCGHLDCLTDRSIEEKRDVLKLCLGSDGTSTAPKVVTEGGGEAATAEAAAGSSSNGLKTCESCRIGIPDLWICIFPGCNSVGCGRTKNAHALHHYLSHHHSVVMKVQTLEMWCYTCRKWLGQEGEREHALKEGGSPSSPEDPLMKVSGSRLEVDVVEEIARRLGMTQEVEECNKRRKMEREMGLTYEGTFYLINRAWYWLWHTFMIGDIDSPGPVRNAELLQRVLGKDDPEMAAPILNFDYGVVMEETWNYIVKTYGGGPPISENMPGVRPAVLGSLRMLRRELFQEDEEPEHNEDDSGAPPMDEEHGDE